jgi:hypothetical protein
VEAALMGFPWVLVINSSSTLEAIEVKNRRTGVTVTMSLAEFLASDAVHPLPYS